ncbi:GntR family transcriptional regulator [Virgibacillus profundi]|uniref:GntR family transcriptional regulator n=1 Tax=Virgibacillus profundi TaxID=2024555 RepID=A0A2A2IAM3_9BACI|nr:GntR family transcriptional regulator [Virgibacillus profundi]PAV28334.1 GntR family transcriptional regulator [Virgibacillus profundi]PXY52304.1 GntR family transcriptional regulator [Virgibacillus profundi]
MLNMVSIKRKNNYTSRDYVYESLKENIISLKLKPGTNISEKEISELLQVSRTPVREAFLKLAQEELLAIYPQRGTFVTLIDLQHVEETRFIREHLERATVREACKNFSNESIFKLEENLALQKICVEEKNYTKLFKLDEDFHYTIVSGCDKKLIWSVIQQMNNHLNRIRILRLADNFNWDLILSQHENIISAIKDKNQDLADRVMEEHLKELIFEQESLKKKYENLFK